MVVHTSHSPAGPDDRDPPGDGAAESAFAPFNALCWPYVHLRGGMAGRPTGPGTASSLIGPSDSGDNVAAAAAGYTSHIGSENAETSPAGSGHLLVPWASPNGRRC